MREQTTFRIMECGHPETDLRLDADGWYCAGCVIDSGNYTTRGVAWSRKGTAELIQDLQGQVERLGDLVDRLAVRL